VTDIQSFAKVGLGVGDVLLVGVAVALLTVAVAVTLSSCLVSVDTGPVPACPTPLESGEVGLGEAWFVFGLGISITVFDGETLFKMTV